MPAGIHDGHDCCGVRLGRGCLTPRLTVTVGDLSKMAVRLDESDDDGLIDDKTIYSNDIWALLCTYGVEAARAAILREVGGVFDVYKIDVDNRHLELIADYMVCLYASDRYISAH